VFSDGLLWSPVPRWFSAHYAVRAAFRQRQTAINVVIGFVGRPSLHFCAPVDKLILRPGVDLCPSPFRVTVTFGAPGHEPQNSQEHEIVVLVFGCKPITLFIVEKPFYTMLLDRSPEPVPGTTV
jgi:hypothetical protein